jgi:hypothetical protein
MACPVAVQDMLMRKGPGAELTKNGNVTMSH